MNAHLTAENPKSLLIRIDLHRFVLFVSFVVFSCFPWQQVIAEEPVPKWLWSTAHAVPKETTSEGSGYFSIIEGHDGKIYIGAAKYGSNAYLVAFDPKTKKMSIAVDCMKEIGSTATGFAAQAKIHTRNNIGESGKIYFGTKQG